MIRLSPWKLTEADGECGMERDWDLIREILLKLEKKGPDQTALTAEDFSKDKVPEVGYQVQLLQEAGLVDARLLDDVTVFFVLRLTWAGHELLDAIRNDTVWARTKQSFLSKGLSMTFDLVKSVAVGIATEYLKSGMCP